MKLLIVFLVVLLVGSTVKSNRAIKVPKSTKSIGYLLFAILALVCIGVIVLILAVGLAF